MTLSYFTYTGVSFTIGWMFPSYAAFATGLLWYQIFAFFVFGIGFMTIEEFWGYLPLLCTISACVGLALRYFLGFTAPFGWDAVRLHQKLLNSPVKVHGGDARGMRETTEKYSVNFFMYLLRLVLILFLFAVFFFVWEVFTHTWHFLAAGLCFVFIFVAMYPLLSGMHIFYGQGTFDHTLRDYVLAPQSSGNLAFHTGIMMLMRLITYGVYDAFVDTNNTAVWAFYIGLIAEAVNLIYLLIMNFGCWSRRENVTHAYEKEHGEKYKQFTSLSPKEEERRQLEWLAQQQAQRQ